MYGLNVFELPLEPDGERPGAVSRGVVDDRDPPREGEPTAQIRVDAADARTERPLLVENRDDHSRVADATATLMQTKTVVDPTPL
jgi:hypothetical protein